MKETSFTPSARQDQLLTQWVTTATEHLAQDHNSRGDQTQDQAVDLIREEAPTSREVVTELAPTSKEEAQISKEEAMEPTQTSKEEALTSREEVTEPPPIRDNSNRQIQDLVIQGKDNSNSSRVLEAPMEDAKLTYTIDCVSLILKDSI